MHASLNHFVMSVYVPIELRSIKHGVVRILSQPSGNLWLEDIFIRVLTICPHASALTDQADFLWSSLSKKRTEGHQDVPGSQHPFLRKLTKAQILPNGWEMLISCSLLKCSARELSVLSSKMSKDQ